MKEKRPERKESLTEREITWLAERLENSEKAFCGRLNDLELRMKALELYVATVVPNTSGTTHDIQSRIFDIRPARM